METRKETNRTNISPLADRMRPVDLEEMVGQVKVAGKEAMLRRAIEAGEVPSMILWGPPGSGKTTLARLIAGYLKAEFIQFSAVTSGVRDLRKIIDRARENLLYDKKTILFIDEIHRWNKAQQDALLPHVENGTIVFIGTTTENPSFEVRPALLSRCRVFVLEQLSESELEVIIKRALADTERGLGAKKIKISDDNIKMIAKMSNGDARTALNVLEYASNITNEICEKEIEEAFQKSHLLYDKDGEEHYNIISALHKSLRGSDADAGLYYLARMLEGGEDPLYIARRLVRFASEDIGLANSRALEQAVAAYQACHFIGMPECGVVLAQVVVYLAKCKKSNELYIAYGQATSDVHEHGNLPTPLHIRNAPTKLMKDLGYGKDYKYSPKFDYKEEQEYFPDKLKGKKYLKG
ncbi:MAG: replication-associated recombination protein A [Patescibacteria group bacterium]|jgi:putative ATPase